MSPPTEALVAGVTIPLRGSQLTTLYYSLSYWTGRSCLIGRLLVRKVGSLNPDRVKQIIYKFDTCLDIIRIGTGLGLGQYQDNVTEWEIRSWLAESPIGVAL